MQSLLEKNLISTKTASIISGYNSDYLGRLCRGEKIKGTRVGKTWLIEKDSLLLFVETQKKRKEKLALDLSETREQEYQDAQKKTVTITQVVTPVVHTTTRAQTLHLTATSTTPFKSPFFSLAVALLVVSASAFASTSPIFANLAKSAGEEMFALATDAGFTDGAIARFRVTEMPVMFGSRVDTEIFSAVAIAEEITQSTKIAVHPKSIVTSLHAEAELSAQKNKTIADERIASVSNPQQGIQSLQKFIQEIPSYARGATDITLYAYKNLLLQSGEVLLASGSRTRDEVALIPYRSQEILSIYRAAVFAWVKTSPVVAERIAGATIQIGSEIESVGVAAPKFVASTYNEAVIAWVAKSNTVAQEALGRQIAYGESFVDFTENYKENHLVLIEEMGVRGVIAYEEGRELALGIPELQGKARDTALGTAGKIALAFSQEKNIRAQSSGDLTGSVLFSFPDFPRNIASIFDTNQSGIFARLQGIFSSARNVVVVKSISPALTVIPFGSEESFSLPSGAESLTVGVGGAGITTNGSQIRNYYFQDWVGGVTHAEFEERMSLMNVFVVNNIDSMLKGVSRRSGGSTTTIVGTGTNYFTNSGASTYLSTGTNLGIGTTSPSELLSVEGNALISGSLTLGALNGPLQANNGLISATTSIGVVYGGTGLASIPTYGQILVGDGVGGYTLLATSSIGLAGSNFFSNSGLFTYLSTGTKLGIGTTTPTEALSVVGNVLIEGNSTTTNATTTTFFTPTLVATNATTTTLYSTIVSAITGTFDSLFSVNALFTNSTTTSATSTNFFATLARFTDAFFTNITATLATITDAVITNLTGTNIAFTNATTTSATSTNLYALNTVLTNATSTNFSTTNLTASGATTTTLYTSNLGLSSSYFTSLLGNGLTNSGGLLSVATSSLASGFFQQGGNSYGATATLGTADNNPLNIITNNSAVATFLTSGELGLGTTTPSQRLSVQGNALFSGDISVAGISATGTVTVGGLSIASLSGFLKATAGVVATSLIDLSTDVTSTLPATSGGTGFASYTAGDLLYVNNSGNLSILPVGTAGQVLKVTGGVATWGIDQTSGGGGGATAWATTTDSLAIYPADTSDVIIFGNSATTTTNSILEVFGKSYFSDRIALGTTSPWGLLSVNPNGVTGPSFVVGSSTATNFIVTNGGLVGIGTTTPGQELSVAGDALISGSINIGTTITTGGNATFGNAVTGASFQTNSTLGNANLGTAISSVGTGALNVTTSQLLLPGSANVMLRLLSRGSTSTTITAGGNYASLVMGLTGVTEAASGNHPLFAQVALRPLTVTSGVATVATTSTLYIEDAATTTSATGGNYALYVANGATWLNGTTTVNGNLSTFGLTIDTLNGPLQANNGVVSATTSIGVLYGGTGLTTAPTYGQMLVGNSSGGYTLTATSSLGLGAGTVTSIDASGGTTGLSFSGGPITTTGTLTLAGTLGVSNGGTGSTTLTGLLKGNGTGQILTAVAGTDYESPLTFNAPLSRSLNAISIAQATTGVDGYLSSSDFNIFNNKISSTSLSASYPLAYNSGTGVFTTDFSTTTTNVYSGLNTFNGGLTLGTLNGPLQANNGVVSATTSIGVLYGGTGLTTIPSYGQILVGNGTGYTLTATSSLGLAPTFSTTYPLQLSSNVLSLAFGTTTANQWSALQEFNGGASSTQLTTTGTTYLATLGGNVGIGSTSPTSQLSINPIAGGATNIFTVGSSTGQLFNIDNSGATTITSASAAAFTVGLTGATNPALTVDASTASSVTGIAIKSAATGGITTITATDSGANSALTIASKGSGALLVQSGGTGNATFGSGSASGAVILSPGTLTRLTMTTSLITFAAGNGLTTASSVRFGFTGTTDTALTAAAEAPSVYFNSGQIRSHSAGAITVQRDFRITPSTHTFSAGSSVANATIASSSALSIDSASVAGTLGAITNSYGLFINNLTAMNGASTTNAYGMTVMAPNGATNNFAATFLNGSVGIGTTSPTSLLSVQGSALFSGNLSLANLTATGTATIGSLTGLIKGTAGVLSAATAGTDYESPLTFNAPLSRSLNAISIAQATTGVDGYLSSSDFNIFNNKISSTSLSASYPLAYNSGTGVFTTDFSTTTTNVYSGLNTFNGGLTLGTLNGPLQANNGVVSATTSVGVLYGGTGLTTAPTYGQMLVGNSSGGYTLMATSSLGITGGANYFTNSGASTYLSTGTNLGIGTTSPWGQLSINPDGIIGPAFVIGSSTATNFIVTNGGDVGVGTTSPGATFAVQGKSGTAPGATAPAGMLVVGGAGADDTTAPGAGGLLKLVGGTAGGTTVAGVGAIGGALEFYGGTGGISANSDGGAGGDVYISGGVGGVGAVDPGGFGKVILGMNRSGLATGNVGIGTSTPVSRLAVSGGTTIGSNYNVFAPTDGLLVEGVVGIGTTSPTSQLSINPNAGGPTNIFTVGSSTGQLFNIANNGATTITSASAAAFTVGLAGATNPALTVDASTASSVTGIAIKSAVTGGATTITSTDPGSSGPLTIAAKGSGQLVLNGNAASGSSVAGVTIQSGGSTRAQFGTYALTFSSATNATAGTVRFGYTSAADTTLTASTEAPVVYFNLSATRSHSAGAITVQRDFRVTPSTHTFTGGASVANATIASSSALSIDSASVAGTRGAITNSYALFINNLTAMNGASTTNAYGMTVMAPSGATNNYAATFLNGNVGVGTTAPAAQFTTTGTVQFANFGAGTVTTDAAGNISVSSDERLKTLNGSFSRGLAEIKQLNPILYHWNTISGLDKTTQYAGFSAQNVQGAIPEAVDTDPRGYLSLSDRPILASAINAIKELAGTTDSLSIASSSLSARLTGVENTVATQQQYVLPQTLTASTVISGTVSASNGISARSYTAPLTPESYTFGSTTVSADIPSSVLSTNGSDVDIYKLATYALASVQNLASRTDLLETKIENIDARIAALEQGITASSTPGTLFSTSTITDALESFGVMLTSGIAQFNTLVFRQIIVTKDADGTSSASSVVVGQGMSSIEIDNSLVHPSSKIFITFTSSITGSWHIAEKKEGKFRVEFAQTQPTDVTFDYFIIQTEGQLATPSVALNPIVPPANPPQPPTVPQAPPPATGVTVTLAGEAGVQIPQGASWIDPGASASDPVEGDISASIVVSGAVDAGTPGLYTLTYTATNTAGVRGEASRIITVLAPTMVSDPVPAPPDLAPDPVPVVEAPPDVVTAPEILP